MQDDTDIAKHNVLRGTSAWKDAILDSADFTIISTDLNGFIVTCNTGTLKKLGYTADEIIGKSPLIFHDPEEVERRVQEFSKELHCTVLPEQVFTAPDAMKCPFHW